jgi:xanthine dehydrogenase YagS FAD-binding subunit
MERFAWQQARSVAEAATLAKRTVAEAMLADPAQPAAADCVVLKAGGIDLLDLMKERLLRPARVVNLREIPGLGEITMNIGTGDTSTGDTSTGNTGSGNANARSTSATGASAGDASGVRIGALVTLAQLAAHPALRQRYTALADAAASSASPQIRQVATLGGNLLQRPRCWYFRSAAHHCARKGGDHCFAFAGENHYHAVFGQAGCAIVHPSTVATALVALDARVELATAQGTSRTVKLGDFLVGPEIDIRRETDLRAGEVLTAVLLPPASPGARSAFLKQAEKPSFDWSIADVAVVLECASDGRCRRAAVVLGATAPVPWRARQAESVLAGQMIDPVAARAAGQAAIAGAAPLPHNAYKLPILAALVRRAVLQAAGTADPEDAR